MARLKFGTIILPLVLFLMIVGTSAAYPEGVSCDSSNSSSQLHEGAKSLRFSEYGQGYTGGSLGWRYHFTDSRALQISLGLGAYSSKMTNDGSDYERDMNSSDYFGFEVGTICSHYFMPEHVFSPYFGVGPNSGSLFLTLNEKNTEWE